MIIDNGSGSIKVGFTATAAEGPSLEYLTVVGLPKQRPMMNGQASPEFYFGVDALRRKGILKFTRPKLQSTITDWDDMQRLWVFALMELKTSPNRQPLFMTEQYCSPDEQKQQMYEQLFEEFKVPSLLVHSTAPLVLHAEGRMTGLVLECGAGVTNCCAVHDGAQIV